MKRILFFFSVFFLYQACAPVEDNGTDRVNYIDQSRIRHGEIVLGEKLDDPYSVSNIDAALRSLYGPDMASVRPTDIYVRFLPTDEDQYAWLTSHCERLLDHPVDYAIAKEGDWYHDPSIPSDEMTWQYAVVDSDFEFPGDIRYEVIDMCFIPEKKGTRADDGIDWEAVEKESYRLTGNSSMLPSSATRASDAFVPSGRICIVDDSSVDGKIVGVSGVKVVCNTFVKFDCAYTDGEGYYSMKKEFATAPRYRLVFQNRNDFSLGFDFVFVPASVSTLGEQSPEGVGIVIDRNSDRKMYLRSVINNAAWDYYGSCDEFGIATPPSGLRIWFADGMGESYAVMMKRGVILDDVAVISNLLSEYLPVVKYFSPDLVLGLGKAESYASVYGTVIHSMAHASHYSRVGKEWWMSCLKDRMGIVPSSLSGQYMIAEMWADYMQNKLYRGRYRNTIPGFGNYTSKPQVLSYLETMGMSTREIFSAFDSSVSNLEMLRASLKKSFSGREEIVDQAFNRYI